mmetsp:Transcript_160806/g.296498  ORF Transcript_160806/g.296498 Transcript_160806/m.296498 type:complete len:249 (-) Transcript_160806:99-845(-)
MSSLNLLPIIDLMSANDTIILILTANSVSFADNYRELVRPSWDIPRSRIELVGMQDYRLQVCHPARLQGPQRNGANNLWRSRCRRRRSRRVAVALIQDSKIAMVFGIAAGVVLLLLVAVASILILHSKKGTEAEQPPSSCVTAQNSTATCSHFEFVGERLWDSSVSNFVSGTVDNLEDCCGGCDKLEECQAWIFESIGRRCRWLRFLESPCQDNPGDLRCRCLTHYGTTFGFKPASQVVWVKREQGRV